MKKLFLILIAFAAMPLSAENSGNRNNQALQIGGAVTLAGLIGYGLYHYWYGESNTKTPSSSTKNQHKQKTQDISESNDGDATDNEQPDTPADDDNNNSCGPLSHVHEQPIDFSIICPQEEPLKKVDLTDDISKRPDVLAFLKEHLDTLQG